MAGIESEVITILTGGLQGQMRMAMRGPRSVAVSATDVARTDASKRSRGTVAAAQLRRISGADLGAL